MEINQFDLLLFDIDGTIAPQFKDKLTQVARDFFNLLYDHPDQPEVGLVTNQGGVSLRHWMEDGRFGDPSKLPKLETVQTRMDTIVKQIPVSVSLYIAYAYQSKKNGRRWAPVPRKHVNDPAWSRWWRKPNPGMIEQAMRDVQVSDPARVLFVGDMKTDEAAAKMAGAKFAYAKAFWNQVPTFMILENVA